MKWLSPLIATPEAVQKLANTVNDELYSVAKACVTMTKLADVPQSEYALAGRLVGSKSGYLLLEVPNAIVRGAFDALHEVGAELPPGLNAHITVMRREEIEQIGGLDKITERGHFFRYQLGPVQSVNPQGWPEMSKCWYIKVRSPELEKLRKSYGLSARPKDNEHYFHISIAVRRKTVLQENDVSKAAFDLTHEVASEEGTASPIPAVRQEARKPRVRVFMPTNGHFLLQRAITNPRAFRVPGGGVEPGETHLQALQREIHEEFDKRPQSHELKYLGTDPRPFFPKEYYYLWRQHGLHPGTYQASNDDQEIINLEKRRATGRDYWGPPVSDFGLHKHSNWMDKVTPQGTIEEPEKHEKVIYVVRHGRTAMNSGDPNKDRIRGWKDVPLDAEGKKEAVRLGQMLKDVKPTRIYTSNLSRTEATAKKIATACGNKHIHSGVAVRPWNVGKYQGQISAKVHPILAEHAKKTPDEVIEGGESFNQFRDRYLNFLKKCMAADDSPIIVVCHFRNCKLTQAWIADGCKDDNSISEEVFLRNDLPTGAILKLTNTDGSWKCELEAAAEQGKGEVKVSADSMGFISGPSLAPDATDINDEDSQPIIDRPDDLEQLNNTNPPDNSPKGKGRGTTKWAMDLLAKAIVGRYVSMEKEADDNYIGHYKPKEKVTRQAFGYLPPKGDKDNFAQCETCIAFTGSDHNTCMILGDEHVTKEMSCNYYQHGKPNSAGAGKEKRILTPKQAGLVNRKVRCENCAFFDHEESYCELYEKLSEEWPQVFDLDKGVNPKGCCNFQTPKGSEVEEKAKEAALWFLHDELSKEKEAAANRISLTVIDPYEKKADVPDVIKRIGLGTLGAGAVAGGANMLRIGWNKPGRSILGMGHQLWLEPENQDRLQQQLGDPASATTIANLANTDRRKFHSLLAGEPVPDIHPDLQRKVREVTFGHKNLPLPSQPGDILATGHTGSGSHLQGSLVGTSVSSADIGGGPKGSWIGMLSDRSPIFKHTQPYSQVSKQTGSGLRLLSAESLPASRIYAVMKPRGDTATGRFNPKTFDKWLSEHEQKPFSGEAFANVALREVVPELSTAKGHLLNSTPIKQHIARAATPKAYERLKASGYTPEQASDICSSFVSGFLKKRWPQQFGSLPQEISPMQLARLAEPSGPYRIHQLRVPQHLQTSKELRGEHRRTQWGPLAWRLPAVGALLGAGGYLGHRAFKKASAQHGLEIVKIKRRDKDVCICPHCGKEVEDKDLYRDAKGWIFHRPCFAKGKGSIKISNWLRKLAFSGGLGSDPVRGMTATDPPHPTEGDGSTQAAKITQVGSLFSTMAGTEETQKPLDNVGISYNTRTPMGIDSIANGYQPSSAVGAQGRMHPSSNAAGAGQEFGYPSGEAAMSAPPISEDQGDMSVDTESSTANYGQVPHLAGPGGFV